MAQPKEPLAARTRWGGAMLALGLALALASFALVTSLGEPPADPAARARAIAAEAPTVRLAATLGMYGNALVAVGALFLAARPLATVRELPASAFWLPVALGALLFTGLDAFEATALPALAAGYAGAPGVFEAAEAALALLVGLGSLAMALGAAMVLRAEADASGSPLPRPAAWAGAVCMVLVAAAAAAELAGLRGLGLLWLAAFPAFVALLALGLRLSLLEPDAETAAAPRTARA